MKPVDLCILSLSVLLNAGAQLGLKAATRATGPLVPFNVGISSRVAQLLTLPALWCALFAYALSVAIWIVGLSRVPVSRAYPLLSIGYVLNIGLAWWLLNETPNMRLLAGTAVIIVGVVLVAKS